MRVAFGRGVGFVESSEERAVWSSVLTGVDKGVHSLVVAAIGVVGVVVAVTASLSGDIVGELFKCILETHVG